MSKLLYIISAIIFIAMGTTDGKIAPILSIILGLYFCFVIFKQDESFEDTDKKTYLPWGIAISFLNSAIFFVRWHDTKHVNAFFESIHLNEKYSMLGITVVGMALSIPFSCFFLRWIKNNTKLLNCKEKTLDVICNICIFTCFIIQILWCFNIGIWADEAFTIAMLRHGYKEMIQLTAADVHPPLYYILLKGWTDFWKLIVSENMVITVTKIFSLIPCFLMFVLSISKIKKYCGKYVATIWFLSIGSASYLISNGVEIRMYSWAMLFVTFSFVMLFEIINDNKIVSWILFVVSSLAAAYTHYFALVAVAVLYGMLFIWLVWKNRKMLVAWFGASIITVIGYLPWLFVFIKQAQNVNDNYWINKIGKRTVVSYFSYMFDNNLLLIVLVVLIVLAIKKKVLEEKNVYAGISSICVPVGVIIIGVAASVLLRPVFVIRYVIPAMGCLWLGIIMLASELKLDNLKKYLRFTVLVLFISNTVLFVNTEIPEMKSSVELRELFETSGNDVAFVSDNFHVQIDLQAFTNKKSLLWHRDYSKLDDRNSELLNNVFEQLGENKKPEDVHELLEQCQSVYFFVKEKGTDVTEFEKENNVKCEKLGKYFVEYNLNVYRVHK